jgi:uncharacterized membrane protein YidH (DUF202 family)
MFSPDQRAQRRAGSPREQVCNARVIRRGNPKATLAVLILAPNGFKGTHAMRKILAILLIIGGIAALATPYITYTETERVVDVGPIEIDAEKEKTIPIPQIAAVAAIIIGIGMLALGSRSEV